MMNDPAAPSMVMSLEERQRELWATVHWGNESRQYPQPGTEAYAQKLAKQRYEAVRGTPYERRGGDSGGGVEERQ